MRDDMMTMSHVIGQAGGKLLTDRKESIPSVPTLTSLTERMISSAYYHKILTYKPQKPQSAASTT